MTIKTVLDTPSRKTEVVSNFSIQPTERPQQCGRTNKIATCLTSANCLVYLRTCKRHCFNSGSKDIRENVGVLLLTQPLTSTFVAADELPDFLQSKGGVIYPITGDSAQKVFRTPPFAKDYLKPGMLIGVLPNDCKSANRGTIGDYYMCHHDLALKPEEQEGKTVYRVIEVN